jgi:hypothetical protein
VGVDLGDRQVDGARYPLLRKRRLGQDIYQDKARIGSPGKNLVAADCVVGDRVGHCRHSPRFVRVKVRIVTDPQIVAIEKGDTYDEPSGLNRSAGEANCSSLDGRIQNGL